MELSTAKQETTWTPQSAARSMAAEPRWDLAFLGILGYLIVEYTRLPVMFPILESLRLGKVVVGLALLGWLVSVHPPGSGDRSPARLMDAGIGLMVLVCLFSSVFANHPAPAWDEFPDVVRWLVIYFLIGRVVSGRWRLRVFALFLMLLNLKLAQFAIREYVTDSAHWQNAAVMAKFGVGAGSTGFFGNAGDFGVAMAVVWPLAGMLFLGHSKKLAKLFYLGSFAAISGAILLCGSRGAFVAAVFTAFVASLRNLRRLGIALLFVLLVPVFFYLLPEGSKDRLKSAAHWQQDQTASNRLTLWRAGLKMFREHTVLGVGLGNFPEEYRRGYVRPGEKIAAWVPHSIYVQALSELGAAGGVSLLFMLFSFFRLNARTLKSFPPPGKGEKRPFEYYLAHGLNLAMVGYLISGAFLTVLFYPHLWILCGLSVGLYTASTRPEPATTRHEAEVQPSELALAAPGGGRY